MAMLVPLISEVKREAIATPAASSEAELMRLPVDNRSIEFSMLLFTLLAAAWAIKAPVFVPTESAIYKSPKLPFCLFLGAQRHQIPASIKSI
jgi:hypothetical protein